MQPQSCPSARERESCASSAESPLTLRPNAHSHPYSSSSGTISSLRHPTRRLRQQQGDVFPDPRLWNAFAHHGTRGAVPSQAHAGSDTCVSLAGAKAIGRRTPADSLYKTAGQIQPAGQPREHPTLRLQDADSYALGNAAIVFVSAYYGALVLCFHSRYRVSPARHRDWQCGGWQVPIHSYKTSSS